jgi:hypothetical protein
MFAVAGLASAAAHSWALAAVLVGYMAVAIAHSTKHEQRPLLDGLVVAALYVSRLVAGVITT